MLREEAIAPFARPTQLSVLRFGLGKKWLNWTWERQMWSL
jgi:hypothetical protein